MIAVIKDITGREIKVGDIIANPMRRSSSVWLSLYKVDALVSARGWAGSEEIHLTATPFRGGKKVTLSAANNQVLVVNETAATW